MCDSDILKFNSFNGWIAAGVMTKLVVARGQQIRSEGNNNEVMKQLTILHIKSWEEEIFEDAHDELYESPAEPSPTNSCEEQVSWTVDTYFIKTFQV